MQRINARLSRKDNKSNSVAFGRTVVEKPDSWNEVYQRWQGKEITATEAMRLTGVKRTTFYKLVKE